MRGMSLGKSSRAIYTVCSAKRAAICAIGIQAKLARDNLQQNEDSVNLFLTFSCTNVHYVGSIVFDTLVLLNDRDDNFQKAMSEVTGDSVAHQLKSKKELGQRKEDADIFKLVKMILLRNYDPVRPQSVMSTPCIC